MLQYLARLYDKITSDKPNAIYGRNLVEMPNPVFIVLYNGVEDYPAKKILNISTGLKKGVLNKKFVYLEVMVININKGRNPELERRCKTLADYASLIEKIREYQKNHTLEEAIRLAVKYCINNNILKEYLEQHASEVINMLTTEFNMDEALEVARWEGLEKGIEKGRVEGIEEGIEKGRVEGIGEGLEKGMVEGIEKGKKEGQNYVLELMAQGLSYEEIKKKIENHFSCFLD